MVPSVLKSKKPSHTYTRGQDIEGAGTITMRTKAEVDTSAPFRSVKEAVVLFGERVLGTQVYAHNLTQMHDDGTSENYPNLASIAAELEETKQSLLRAREESMLMANCLTSMQEELQHAKIELQQLKERKPEKEVMVVEEHKFLQHSPDFDVKTETFMHDKVELQKKRYVTFADPPTVSHLVVPPSDDHAVLQRHPSLKKPKKKPLIPLIKGIFRKKTSSEVAFA